MQDRESDTIAEAAAGVVLTMVTNGAAIEQVAELMLDGMPAEAAWLQTTTVAAAAAGKVSALARRISRPSARPLCRERPRPSAAG